MRNGSGQHDSQRTLQGQPLASCRSQRAVCILAALVYDARASMAARIAVENPRIQRPYPGGIAVGMDLGPERKAQQLQ